MKKWVNEPMTQSPCLGIALGSGSARGWAHIGVLRALAAAGIEPDIVCGTSIGALVGGAYAAGRLDALETWVRSLSLLDVIGFMDVTLTRGGLITGEKLFKGLRRFHSDVAIQELGKPFAAVATDFGSGREIWLQKGSLLDAVRASTALPGIFPPVKLAGQWLMDGGLVNPVPVSVCRALGAEVVIAVNLNGDLTTRNVPSRGIRAPRTQRLAARLKFHGAGGLLAAQLLEPKQRNPGVFEVLAGALYIMQDRITRSRMAGDPPDAVLAPRVAHIRLLEFHRAEEAIEAGRACVAPMLSELHHVFALLGAGGNEESES